MNRHDGGSRRRNGSGTDSASVAAPAAVSLDPQSGPPPFLVDILPRPRLIAALDDGLAASVTVIVAPPGFGKTVVCAQWYRHLVRQGRPCRWVSLDDTWVSLDEDLGRLEAGTVLFLDDLDRLPSQALIDDACRFFARIPAEVHVVATVRSLARLRISRLLAEGVARRMTADQLRFTMEETSAFLAHAVDHPHRADLVAAIAGWPVLAQLIRLEIEQGGQGSAHPMLVSRIGAIPAYLDEQIIDRLQTDLAAFLGDAAILPGASLELLNSVRGSPDGAQMIERLRFLHPLVDARQDVGRPRLNPVLADRLAVRRDRDAHGERRRLLLAAADWFTEREDLPSAVTHLIAAGQPDRAGELVNQGNVFSMVGRWGVPRIRAMFDQLPRTTIRKFEQLRLLHVIVLLDQGDIAAAEAEFAGLSQQGDADDALGRDRFTVGIFMALRRDRFPSAETMARAPGVVIVGTGLEASNVLWNQQRGLFDAADQQLHRLQKLPDHDRRGYNLTYLYIYRALIAFGRGDLGAASLEYARAREVDPVRSDGGNIGSMMADILRAELHYEVNEMQPAERLLHSHRNKHDVIEEWFDVYVVRRSVAARLEIASGRATKAIENLQVDVDLLRAQGMAAREIFIRGLMVELLMQTGEVDKALEIGQHVPGSLGLLGEDDILPWRLHDQVGMARARLALAAGDTAAALGELSSLRDRWERLGVARGLIRVHLLTAAVHGRLDDGAALARSLRQGLSLALRTGHCRVLLDERGLLGGLLSRVIGERDDGGMPAEVKVFGRRIARMMDLERSDARGTNGAPVLTRRERDVLVELGRGKTNKMIAQGFHISENTVKLHVRNVYGKLKVRRRVQAVEEGRRRALIP